MRKLSLADLNCILNGATILGAGGGGPKAVAEEYLKFLSKRPPVMLASPSKDIKASQIAAVVAGVGSPDASSGFSIDVPLVAFKKINALVKAKKKKSISYVMPIEVGAGNSFVPLGVASQTGLPVLDVSGARRAVPSLTQCTYAKQSVSPVVLANKTTEVDFDTKTVAVAEPTIRGIITSGSFTEDAGLALWPMNGTALRKHAVPRTMSYALRLGKALRNALKKKQDPVQAVRNFLKGYILFVGKIIDSTDHTQGGFDFGTISLQNKAGVIMTIYNQNENLIAWRSDAAEPQAIAPDLISYLTTDGLTFSNAELSTAKGKEVAIIGSKCTRYLRSASLIEAFQKSLVGIGYGGAYKPIEQIQGSRRKRR